jgi:hypothetical protein
MDLNYNIQAPAECVALSLFRSVRPGRDFMKNNRSLRKYRITGDEFARAGEALANWINSL